MSFDHTPVMLDEVLAALDPVDGEVYVDATLGGGGYSEAILSAAECRVIGLDRDPSAIAAASERLARFGDRFTAARTTFSRLGDVLDSLSVNQVNGLVADLGVSSPQLDDPDRGFSFRAPGPVDMRMDPDAAFSASDIVNGWDETEIANTLFQLGDEKRSRAVARAIVAGRPWTDTLELANAIAAVVGRVDKGRIHPATRSFQALRMAVNDELGELERLLDIAVDRLLPGGRLVVVSFHSHEDRLVKQFLARRSGRGVDRDPWGNPTTHPSLSSPPRPTLPPEDEPNPRARSARLRSAVRLPWNAR
jgi:16S rRNA (cytosine1402-N4)-methyltransferase